MSNCNPASHHGFSCAVEVLKSKVSIASLLIEATRARTWRLIQVWVMVEGRHAPECGSTSYCISHKLETERRIRRLADLVIVRRRFAGNQSRDQAEMTPTQCVDDVLSVL